MAAYQHASDAHGGQAYSGVVRADGRWCPCAAGNTDWAEYVTWTATEPNVADPYKAPVDGGVAIVLQTDEVAYGAMLDSLTDSVPPDIPPQQPGPPVNVDVPHLQGTGVVGETMTITMGNWNYEPTAYSAQWLRNAAIQVGTGPEYVVQAGDVGGSITCTVTAENSMGFTVAAPSNAVMAIAPAGTGMAARAAPERAVPRHEPEAAPRSRHRE